jgi:hypothetical protein
MYDHVYALTGTNLPDILQIIGSGGKGVKVGSELI